jgi:hypothetical protein
MVPALLANTRLALTLRAFCAVALASATIAACEGPESLTDDTEGSDSDLTDPRLMGHYVNGISRIVNVANGQQRRFTGDAYNEPLCKLVPNKPGPPRKVCATNHVSEYSNAILHEDPNATASDNPFPAKWGDREYQGCGVAAAYNVLAYFGASNPYPGGIRFTKFSDSRIMSVPSYLRTDLENALNRQANGTYEVRTEHGAPAFRIIGHALAAGDVVVALVNNGTHWQVITGLRAAGADEWSRTLWEYYAVDYGFGGRWRTEGDLELEFSGWDAAVEKFGESTVDYMSNTFLIAHKVH